MRHVPDLCVVIARVACRVSRVVRRVHHGVDERNVRRVVVMDYELALRSVPVVRRRTVVPVFLALFFRGKVGANGASAPFFPFSGIVQGRVPIRVANFCGLSGRFFLVVKYERLRAHPRRRNTSACSVFRFSALFLF